MNKILYGLGVTVLGMVVVFVGLLILICFIKLLSKLMASKKAEKKVQEVTEKPVETPAAAEEAPSDELSPEIIAAITAAIAAVWDKPTGFVVRHVKRVNASSAWSRSGRDEQNYSLF